MNLGFYIIMAAQFFSSLADNALLVAAIALLIQSDSPAWLTPYLKFFFVISYVLLAPFVGAFADRLPKGQVMFISNTIKIVGCTLMLFHVNPLLAYALVGLGAAAYSPAKYGILTEYLPPTKLVVANGWIEGLTVGSIILGTVLGGVLISQRVAIVTLSLDIPMVETGIDTPAEAAICLIILIYALAAFFNLYVPRTSARGSSDSFGHRDGIDCAFDGVCALALVSHPLNDHDRRVSRIFCGAHECALTTSRTQLDGCGSIDCSSKL